MKTVVIFKWNKDPRDARIDSLGNVEWGAAKMSASDDDPAAMELARAISAPADIIGLTVGDGDASWAAARGAASTIVVEDVTSDPDGRVVACAIANTLADIADLGAVIIGDSDWERSVVSALAAQLGRPAFADVIGGERVAYGLNVTVRGAKESVILAVPETSLLCVKGLSSERDVPSMRAVIQGRKKPRSIVSVAAVPSGAAALRLHLPDKPAATIIDGADAPAAVAQLLEALRGDGLM